MNSLKRFLKTGLTKFKLTAYLMLTAFAILIGSGAGAQVMSQQELLLQGSGVHYSSDGSQTNLFNQRKTPSKADSIINTRPSTDKSSSQAKDQKSLLTDDELYRLYSKEPLSSIEKVYNSRLPEKRAAEKIEEEDEYMIKEDKKLRQFGYDFFKVRSAENFLPVGDKYAVGPGDTLFLYFWGDPVDILGLNGFYSITVDRDGKIFVPNLGVFYVWGLEINKIKKIVHNSLAKKYKRFEIALTLGQLRQFPVYVSGFVEKPGVVQSLGTYSIIDVLVQAGGVAKNGSLRNIEITRMESGKQKKIRVDLYDFLVSGKPADVTVREGDSVLVNEIGKTAAVTGDVKRPAIYEISNGDTVQSAIDYAGGASFSAYNPGIKHYRYENDKVYIYEGSLDKTEFLQKVMDDGDFIGVEQINSVIENEIEVAGHIRYPGKYSWKEGLKLSEVMKKAQLLPDTDARIGDVRRKHTTTVISFAPENILNGKSDIVLEKRDQITFYPRWLEEPMHVSGQVEESKLVPYFEGIKMLDALKQVRLKGSASILKAEIYSKELKTGEIDPAEVKDIEPADELFKEDEKEVDAEKASDENIDLFLKSNPELKGLFKRDEQKADPNVKLTESEKMKIMKLGKKEKDTTRRTVYLHDLLVRGDEKANLKLRPGDKIVIRKTESNEKNKTITLIGEVNKPGVYEYKPGMKLSDIIEAAGGYTDTAYPRGLIFTRRNAQRLQMNQINISMVAMEEYVNKSSSGLAAAGGSDEEKSAITIVMRQQQQMLALIKKKSKMALGRLALDIPATIDSLKSSDDNIELVQDDYIFVPAKPNYVLVLGNVYNQISMPHVQNKTVEDYLDDVGGPAKNSDLDNIYVIKANGKIISRDSYENFFRDLDDLELEEGDAVVVPFEINIPVMWRPMFRDITQIIFQSVSTLVMALSL